MEDVSLNQIDYKWVDNTEDSKKLKKALKMLKDDGGYFPELEKYLEDKLIKIDKKFKAMNESRTQKISEEELRKQNEDILTWENQIKQADKILSGKSENEIYSENKKKIEISNLEKKKLAENEKIKGNELMKTKEFDEAIQYYTNSVKLDPDEPTTYCNRALAYIKRKQFENGLQDCDKAISLKKDYSKAYYRRAVCLMSISKFNESLNDLLFVLAGAPSSPEVLEELKNLKDKWSSKLSKEQWTKIEADVNLKVEKIKDPKRREEILKNVMNAEMKIVNNLEKSNENTKTNTQDNQNNTFKKIKIVEEVIEDINSISPELKTKFDKFICSGEEVKKELQRLIGQQKYKIALDIARESLKECQNFIKEFKPTSDYHLKIETDISDLNNLIVDISSQSEETEKNKQKETNEQTTTANGQNDKKYFKTKILSEEIRENATKIAETDMNFDDFPKTAFGFEKAFNSMKNRPDLFFNYLKILDPNNLPIVYQSSEMSYHIMIGILQTLTKYTFESEEYVKLTLKYLINITKTKNFALLKKFLKRSDKEFLRTTFIEIKEKHNAILNSFDVDLEKSYF